MSDDLVEVSKSLLNQLQGTANVANKLWNDEKVGLLVKERVKELLPNSNIPEVDLAHAARKAETELLAKVEATKTETISRIEAFEKAQKERDEKDSNAKAEREFASDVESVKRKYQLTSEGMEKVFARMKEKNNPDVESAAAWVTDHETKAAPLTNNYAPQSMDLYGSKSGDKDWEELNRDPLAYGDRMLAEMANDFANGNFSKYREFGGNL